jgi:hypothetical protein
MTEAYFQEAIDYIQSTITERAGKLQNNTGQIKKPQILAQANFRDQCELLVARYSAGHPVDTLTNDLAAVVSAWEASLATPGSSANDLSYLDDHVRSLWIVSLGLIFRVDDDLWERILACAGNEGQDRMFERLVSTRTPGRAPASKLLHPRAYAFLDSAAQKKSPEEMIRFLKAWYPALQEIGWYDSHKGPEGGGFFGYWAIEAAGVAVVFGIDDSTFKDLPYYPKDLADHGRSAGIPATTHEGGNNQT